MTRSNLLFGFLLVITLLFASAVKADQALPKALKKKYAFVSAGKALIGKDTFDVEAFCISKTEVTNGEYNEFLHSLKDRKALAAALVDSANWGTEFDIAPFAKHYHNHEAYKDYPVVNISYEAALLYCKWLSDKLTKENEGLIIEARLPSRTEWIRAARPTQLNAPYAWEGRWLHNDGKYLCNFRNIGAENVHYNSTVGEYEVMLRKGPMAGNAETPLEEIYITTIGASYWPNELGIYCMNGNVAEMIDEPGKAAGGSWNSTGYDVRIESIADYRGTSCTLGFRPVLKASRR